MVLLLTLPVVFTLQCYSKIKVEFRQNSTTFKFEKNLESSCNEVLASKVDLLTCISNTNFITKFTIVLNFSHRTLFLDQSNLYLTNKTFSYYAKNLYFLKSCSFGSLEETAFEHAFVETDSSLPGGPFGILVDKKKNEVWILVIIILLVIAVLASVIAVSIVCAIKQKKRKRVITLGDYGNRENLLEVPKHERNLLFELHANQFDFANKLRSNIFKLKALESYLFKDGLSRKQMSLIGYKGNASAVGGLCPTMVIPAVDNQSVRPISQKTNTSNGLGAPADDISNISGGMVLRQVSTHI